jgi:hypothetical protein
VREEEAAAAAAKEAAEVAVAVEALQTHKMI